MKTWVFVFLFMFGLAACQSTESTDDLTAYYQCADETQSIDKRVEPCLVLASNPNFDAKVRSVAYFVAGYGLFGSGQYRKSAENIGKAISLNDRNHEFFQVRGLANLALENIEEAGADFDEAVDLNPYDADSFKYRGLISIVRLDFSGAKRDFDEAIRLKPDDPETFVARGITKICFSDFQGALEDTQTALKFDDSNADAYGNLSAIYAYSPSPIANTDKAVENALKAIEIQPKGRYFANLGVARALQGDVDGALDELERAASSDPEQARNYQRFLSAKGYYHGRINGKYDESTRNALRTCIEDNCKLFEGCDHYEPSIG